MCYFRACIVTIFCWHRLPPQRVSGNGTVYGSEENRLYALKDARKTSLSRRHTAHCAADWQAIPSALGNFPDRPAFREVLAVSVKGKRWNRRGPCHNLQKLRDKRSL